MEVVKFIDRFNDSFRILALTATPGSDVESVQKVIDGLDIARTEIRTEESIDIRDFVHTRNVELQIFDNSDEMHMSLELFGHAIRPLMNKLNTQNAYWGKDPTTITAYGLTIARQQWMKSDAGRKAAQATKGMVNGVFNVLASLAHGLELLKFHGIGPFFAKLTSFQNDVLDGNSRGKYAAQIASDEHFKKLMNRLRTWVGNPDFVGHPKLSYLKTVVLNHFMDADKGRGAAGGRPPSDTRIMIFVHYRDSAEEVTRVLRRHEPMVRPHVFVGQSSAKGSEGMDQKTQLDIIDKFKKGTYNTLVATSIGEEGLDIGEVDLIVCYDSSASPIRMLQRMGRTGRKRAGKIVLLLMRGKEEESYVKAKDNYEKMQEKIARGSDFNYHEDRSPRILPREVNPRVDKRQVEIPLENTQPGLPEPRRGKGRKPKMPPKKFHMPDGVETGFTFLGSGSKSDGRRVAASISKTQPAPVLDQHITPLPPLAQVLLSPADEDELDQRFCNIGGDTAQFVQRPRLDRYPKFQRVLQQVRSICHGQVTRSLVRAFHDMHDNAKYRALPNLSQAVLCDLSSDGEQEHADPLPSLSTNGDPGTQSSGMVAPLGVGSAESGELEGIMPLHTTEALADQDQEDEEPVSLHDPSFKRLETQFYVSQQSVRDEGNAEEELPDFDEMVRAKKSRTEVVVGGNDTRRQAQRRRRIVDDDDDDDDDSDV